MIQVKNSSTKQITFPALEFSIGPGKTKTVSENIADIILIYPSIVKIEKKEDTYVFRKRSRAKK